VIVNRVVLNSHYFCKSVKKNALSNNYSNKSSETESFLWLNGNHHSGSWLAVGIKKELVVDYYTDQCLEVLQQFIHNNKGQYIFGAIAFTLQEEIYNFPKDITQPKSFPVVHFFVPRSVFYKSTVNEGWKLVSGEEQDFSVVNELTDESCQSAIGPNTIYWHPTISKEEYIQTVDEIKSHIQLGDIYELNFCYAFETPMEKFNAIQLYQQLNALSRGSFSVFGKLGKNYVLSASPERFIQKTEKKMRSQPIKGTIKRGATEAEDNELRQQLKDDRKEKRENIMIVDLVRNDLSKVAKKGTVQVDELCAIYTFDTVHQMISTISCEVKDEVEFLAIIRALFPMGSMTGAPKKKALELIKRFEKTPRELYSGTIGMIHPNGDFDWNVVIRTLVYNVATKKATYSVGSAITYASNPELEYEETLLKAKLLFDLFNIKKEVQE
jgi:para-aminobenzoate synthetase component I